MDGDVTQQCWMGTEWENELLASCLGSVDAICCAAQIIPLSAAVSTALTRFFSDEQYLSHNKGKAASPVFQRDQTQTPLICNSPFSEPDDASVWSFDKFHFPSK